MIKSRRTISQKTRQTVCIGSYYLIWSDLKNTFAKTSISATSQRHPNSDSQKDDTRICLIYTEKSILFSKAINPACLPPPQSQIPLGSKCFTAGWGGLHSNGDFATKLQEKEVSEIGRYTILSPILCLLYKMCMLRMWKPRKFR